MSWSIASLAGLRCRARRKELPLQEKRFAVRPWTSFLLGLPMKFAVICPRWCTAPPASSGNGWLGSGSGGGQSLVLRPGDDVPLALRKLKAAQIPKQKPFHTHFKTNLNIIRPDPFLGPPYGKALLLKMVRRPHFWGRLAAPVSGPCLLPCRLWRNSSGSMLQWMRRRRDGPLFSSIWTKLHFAACQWLAWHGCQGHFEDASGY